MHHHETAVVDHLKKVKIRLEVFGDITIAPTDVEFIVGLNADGLTGLERSLIGKSEGDEITLTVSPEHVHETIGHLRYFFQISEDCPELRMGAKILSIRTPENREIVKAMAEMSSCDCGCGCGH